MKGKSECVDRQWEQKTCTINVLTGSSRRKGVVFVVVEEGIVFIIKLLKEVVSFFISFVCLFVCLFVLELLPPICNGFPTFQRT